MALSQSQIHQDQVLGNLARTFKFEDHIADMISPRIRVRYNTGVYYTFNREEARVTLDGEGDLAPKCQPSNPFKWEPGPREQYAVERRALKDMICDETIKNADAAIRPVRRTIEKLTHALGVYRERRIAKLFTDTTGVAASQVSSPPISWDDPTADIEDDIRAAREAFRVECGGYPNAIIMSAEVAGYVRLFLKANAEISLGERSQITDIPSMLWGMKTYVSGATMNSAGAGLTEVMSDIWPDSVVLAYINPTARPSLEDSSFSWTFEAQPFQVRRWRDEERRSTVYEVSQCIDEKIFAPVARHIMDDVLF